MCLDRLCQCGVFCAFATLCSWLVKQRLMCRFIAIQLQCHNYSRAVDAMCTHVGLLMVSKIRMESKYRSTPAWENLLAHVLCQEAQQLL